MRSAIVALALPASIACTPIEGIEEQEITSAHTNTTYVLRTYVPEAVVDPSTAPVLIVLDGDWYTEAAIRQVQDAIADGIVPPTIATIGYADANQRARDFTPTATATSRSAGGWAAYLRALEDDLVPALPSGAERIWFGHSLGGLAVTYLTFDAPELADGVIATSPSLWWDEGVAFDALTQADATGAPPVWFSAGSQELFGMVPMAMAMADAMGEDATFTLLAGRDHGSAVSPSLAGGLRSLLGAAP